MESTNMSYSSVQFLLFSFYAALIFYAVQSILNLISKRSSKAKHEIYFPDKIFEEKKGIISERQENFILDNNACKEKEEATLTHLSRKFLDPNFVEEFRKYSSECCRIKPDNCDKFGEYVALELKSLKSENNKKKLENEIRNVIMEIAKQDMNILSSNTYANGRIPNSVLSNNLII